MDIYALDPKNGQKSVSLTILWVSVIYLMAAGVLQALGKIPDTTMAMEFFGISSGLYFGRRVNFKSGDSVEQSNQSNGG